MDAGLNLETAGDGPYKQRTQISKQGSSRPTPTKVRSFLRKGVADLEVIVASLQPERLEASPTILISKTRSFLSIEKFRIYEQRKVRPSTSCQPPLLLQIKKNLPRHVLLPLFVRRKKVTQGSLETC